MDHLLGRAYNEEIHDCFQLQRDYFAMLGIEIRDYAFPREFWEYDDDLYGRLFAREGFYAVDSDGWKPEVNDVLLVPGSARVSFATHAGVLVEGSKVLHHYPHRLSEAVAFKGVWRNPTTILRHKDLKPVETSLKQVTLEELMPDHVKRRLATPKPS